MVINKKNKIKTTFNIVFLTAVIIFCSIKLISKNEVKSSDRPNKISVERKIEIAEKLKKEKNFFAAEEVYLNIYSDGYKGVAYDLGWLYNKNSELKNIEKVYKWWEIAALSGDMRAVYNLAIAYSEGEFYEKDVDKAIELFIDTAEIFNDALIIVGDIYRLDKHDYVKADYYYKKALKSKDKYIQKNAHKALARLYFSDEYLDFLKAFEYAEKAANYGDANSLFAVGSAYVKGIEDNNKEKDIIKKDILKGMLYLEKAADQGHEDSMIYFSYLGLEFAKTKEEETKISKYILALSEKNNLEGIKLAAGIYGKGFGVKRDELKAFSYIVDAANQEDDYSQYYLGEIYKIGNYFIKPNLDRAKYWFNKASLNGNDDAKNELKKMKLSEISSSDSFIK